MEETISFLYQMSSMTSNLAYKEYLDSELASENERSIHGIITQVARYGALKFGVLILNHPFDTARLLRQIQYRDRDRDNKAETSEGPGNESTSSFFDSSRLEQQRQREEDRLTHSQSKRIGEFYAAQGEIGNRLSLEVSRDSTGYIIEDRRSPQQTTKWPLVLDNKCSLWCTIGEIGHYQGLFSAWQGILSGWIHDILMDLGRATVEEALDSSELVQENLNFPFATAKLEDELLRPCVVAGLAQGIIGTLLSPIEMARVRLMAQSVWANERKYSGPINVLGTMIREETGVIGLFRSPLLTFSTYFLKPVLRILPISLLNMICLPSQSTNLPLSLIWLLLQNIAMCIPLVITMPLETIRRRLMVQYNPHNGNFRESLVPFITRVRLSPAPYTGVFNCLWRMLKEEGIGSFYQGWGFQVASVTVSFATTLLAEMGEEDLADDDLEGF